MEELNNLIIDYISNIVVTDDISEEELAAFYDTLKSTMDNISFTTLSWADYLVQGHALTKARSIHEGKLKEPETLKDYQKNLGAVKVAAERIQKNSKIYNPYEKFMGEDLSKYFKMADYYHSFVTQMLYFANAANHLHECAETKSNSAYMREVLKTLPGMEASLKRAGSKVVPEAGFKDGDEQIFNNALDLFLASSRVVSDSVRSIQETEKGILAEEEANKPKAEIKQGERVRYVPTQAEQNRIAWIKKANEYYREFELDYLRDVRKQFSHSTKDMMKTLEEKIQKFLQSFPMPLADNTSVGKAQEAYSQIGKLMEYVSSISENAYTVSVFGNNE